MSNPSKDTIYGGSRHHDASEWLPSNNEAARPKMSLAEQLAKEFPSAKIIVGAPEPAPEPSIKTEVDSRFESKLMKLKRLIEQDKAEFNGPRTFT